MRIQFHADRILPPIALAGISGGIAAAATDRPGLASLLWGTTAAVVLVPLLLRVASDLVRGRTGVDLIAVVAIAAALVLGEYLAAAVVALMLSGGQALEAFAAGRARRELSALLARAPREVMRYEDGALQTRPVAEVEVGNLLLVPPGAVVPVDGIVTTPGAVLDESALTGESRPAEYVEGDIIRSGGVNAGGPFDLRATTDAEHSTYAGIIRLVERAGASKAPFVRLADRYATAFLPITFIVAAVAWAISGEPVRALAVLVIATPCPLILAAPVAIVGGISRAARRGVIVKGGGALETLARTQILLFDKTGTLTAGIPTVHAVEVFGSIDRDALLWKAASLDQVSTHVFARAIVEAAKGTGVRLAFPARVRESPGTGIEGIVNGEVVRVGKLEWATDGRPPTEAALEIKRRAQLSGSSNVFVATDGELAGAILIDDPVRPDTRRTIGILRRSGVERIVMLTGDHPSVAEAVAAAVGADEVLAERSPADKVEAVRAARSRGVTAMVGDGINDAPALAAADVGIAMGARGAGASSEAADVVIAVDRLDRLAEGLTVARRARAIAIQSVVAGMALSIAGMGLAAAGLITPVQGALTQEAIDVAVILNALRALTPGRRRKRTATAGASRLFARIGEEHARLRPGIDRIREVADGLDDMAPERVGVALGSLHLFLTGELAAHEKAEEQTLYPLVAKIVGGDDPTATMTREHLEISHLIRMYSRALDDLPVGGPSPHDLREIRRILYGLHAILSLHMAQEEESYLGLIDDAIDDALDVGAPTRRWAFHS